MKPSKIGLALSGGGFRATLFHLGVVRCFYDAEILQSVRCITSVSGGSILAAHLALNWSRYTGLPKDFDAASKEIVEFTRADIRGRLQRRWLLAWLTVFPRILGGESWKLTNMLQRSYGGLFKNAALDSLPAVPDVHILSTSMTTGDPVSFDSTGVSFDRDSITDRIPTTAPHLSFAVAASSAFPPLFPPIRIDHKLLMCNERQLPKAEYLTDGGIHDNLGIIKLLAIEAAGREFDLVIVSDAGGNFDWAVDRPYTSLVPRNVRASDLLMRRISQLQSLRSDHIHRIRIGESLPKGPNDTASGPGLLHALRNIRTDLDAFSLTEVRGLIDHGYAAARHTLLRIDVGGHVAPSSWADLSLIAGPAVKRWEPEEAAKSAELKLRLWSSRDLVTWLTACMVAFYCCIPILLGLFAKRKVDDLQKVTSQYEMMVDAIPLDARSALVDKLTASVKGSIQEPTPNRKVGRTFPCFGVATGLPSGFSLWLAVEKKGLIWPKNGRLVPGPDNKWEVPKLDEAGGPESFSIILLVADQRATQRIEDWLDNGRRTHNYEDMRNRQGTKAIARIDGLSL